MQVLTQNLHGHPEIEACLVSMVVHSTFINHKSNRKVWMPVCNDLQKERPLNWDLFSSFWKEAAWRKPCSSWRGADWASVGYPLIPPSCKNWSDITPCKKDLQAQVLLTVGTWFMGAEDRTGSTSDMSVIYLLLLRQIQKDYSLFSYNETNTVMDVKDKSMHLHYLIPTIFIRRQTYPT